MAQHDYIIDNQSGLSFRQDLNNALAAGVSLNSGASAPSTTYAYMLWADTTSGLLKQRNSSNSAWVTVGTLDSTNLGLLPAATAASTYAPLTGTGASGTWGISISGNAATATTATTATTLTGTGSLSALDYSYTADFPSVRPSLLLDFANSKTLDARVSFSRASTATYVGADGLIKTAAINEPRFDHNGGTGESLGLLIEEARTNLVTYSEQIDNAAWFKSAITVTADAATAPDGNTTADLVYPSSTGTGRSAYRSVSISSSITTMSFFVKAAGFTRCYLVGGSFATSAAWFDLSAGTVGTVVAGCTASIQKLGNGWYKCVLTQPASATPYISVGPCDADNSQTATASGTSGIYVWGAQLEAGAFPTSYIPTTTATVTRSADVAQMTGTNFSSWYSSNQGSLYVALPNGINTTGSANSAYFGVSSGALNSSSSVGNGIKYGSGSPSTSTRCFIITGGSTVLDSNSATNAKKVGIGYAQNSFAISRDGGTPDTSSSGSVPASMDTFTFLATGSVQYARFAFYPARLTNAQLQNLTGI